MHNKLILFISGLLLLSCNQKMDNPLSSSYDGNYNLKVIWPGPDSLEPFRSYPLRWSSEGEEYDSFDIRTSPLDSACEKSFRSNLTDTGSTVYFSTLFRGKAILYAIRPNGKKDQYVCSLTVRNPYTLAGDPLAGVNQFFDYTLERKDGNAVQNVSSVIWETETEKETLDPDEPFLFSFPKTGTYELGASVISENNDTLKLKPTEITVPGHSPSINGIENALSVIQGETSQFLILAEDTDGDSLKAVVIRGKDTLQTEFVSCTQGQAAIKANIFTRSRDSIVTIHLVDKSGLQSQISRCTVTVNYQEPVVGFPRDTIILPTGAAHRLSVLSSNTEHYEWKRSTGIMDTTAEPYILIESQEESRDTVHVVGIDRFGYRSDPDSIFIEYKAFRYRLQLEEFPDTVPLRSWTTFRAAIYADSGKIESESAVFSWEHDLNQDQISTNENGDSISIFVHDSIPAFSLHLSASVGDSAANEIFRIFKVESQLPACSFSSDSQTVEIQTNRTFHINHRSGHPSRPVNQVYYSVNDGTPDSLEAQDSGETDLRITFDKPGTYTIQAWVKDSQHLLSPRATLKVTAVSDRIWFDPLNMDTAIFINESILLDLPLQMADSSESISRVLIDSDNDGTWDLHSDSLRLPIGPFSDPGTYTMRASAVGTQNDTTLKPVTLNIRVKEGVPTAQIDSVRTSFDDFFINDSIYIHFGAHDSNGTVEKVYLSVDNTDIPTDSFVPLSTSQTVADSLLVHIPRIHAGQKIFRLWSVDNDGLSSTVYADTVTVNLGRPEIKAGNNYGDSNIQWKEGVNGSLDTLFYIWNNNMTRVAVDTADSNGRCVAYYWNWSRPGLVDDTTDVPFHEAGGLIINDTNRITVSAVDEDSVMSLQFSFYVVPDSAPRTPQLVNNALGNPVEGITLRWKNEDVRDGSATLFRIEIGYNGDDPSAVLKDFTPGYEYEQTNGEFRYTFFPESNTFKIKITARDLRGSTAEGITAEYIYD